MTRPKARPTLPSATGWTRRSRGEGGRVSWFSSGGVRGAEGGKGRAGGVRGFYRRARGGRRAIVRRREAADEARPTRWALGFGEGTHHGDASLASGARARTAATTGACVGAGRCALESRGPRREEVLGETAARPPCPRGSRGGGPALPPPRPRLRHGNPALLRLRQPRRRGFGGCRRIPRRLLRRNRHGRRSRRLRRRTRRPARAFRLVAVVAVAAEERRQRAHLHRIFFPSLALRPRASSRVVVAAGRALRRALRRDVRVEELSG